MQFRYNTGVRSCAPQAGMTILELIIASAIFAILATVALPTFRVTIVRQKETELRRDLREMRDAIDRYQDLADAGKIRIEVGNECYPPDLETLVKGVTIGASERVRFLRRIPKDTLNWARRLGLAIRVQDDPDTTSWGGQNVFDVYSKSQATALDGTRYSDW